MLLMVLPIFILLIIGLIIYRTNPKTFAIWKSYLCLFALLHFTISVYMIDNVGYKYEITSKQVVLTIDGSRYVETDNGSKVILLDNGNSHYYHILDSSTTIIPYEGERSLYIKYRKIPKNLFFIVLYQGLQQESYKSELLIPN